MKIFLILLLLVGCKKCPERVPPFTREEIPGRGSTHPLVYHAQVPLGWKRVDPDPADSLLDTTHPNCTFLFGTTSQLTVYSFPSTSLKERIPPQAQVARWKRQADDPAPQITSTSWGGFVGLVFKAKGLLGWSMQLDPDHYQTLTFLENSPEEAAYFHQMRADYTLKAVGPPEELTAHRDEIEAFVKSFELIQAIPLGR